MSKRVNPHIRLITMGLLLVVWSSTTVAETIFVDPNAPGPVQDGNSWLTAYNYLQDGLADAVAGDEIRVANGTYRPDQNAADPDGSNNTSATFWLIDGVGLYGGYAGFGAPDPNYRDIQQYETTLTGVLDGSNSRHVVTGTDTTATAVIDGFTITGGSATGTSGGGMYNYPGSPTVVNCLFRDNSTTAYGGGMYNRNASPALIDCTFTGNNATNNHGGGIYNYNSHPTIINCTFIQNSSQKRGGGICNYNNSNPQISNCLFTGNYAAERGGGIYSSSSTTDLALVNCIFTDNSSAYYGGAMYNDSADPQVTNCTFSGNYADIGGAMYNSIADPQVTNCTFAGNWAISNGGGMSNYNNSRPDITNCTFSANWTVDLGSLGGGMYSNGGTQTVTNCIFWANEDSSGLIGPAQIQGGSPQVTYSCIQDDDPNDGDIPFDDANIDDDPMFVRDPNAGGDGWGDDPCTPGVDEAANDDFGDLHLLPGSPCIDAADNTMVPADTHDLDDDGNTTERTPLDLDYNSRFIDDPTTPDTGRPAPPDDPNIVDMGPYEFAPQPPQGIPGDIDLDGDVDSVDFVILSNQWQGVPGDPSADIAPPGGDGAVNRDDLLIVAANWLAGSQAPIPADLIVDLTLDETWMYQNLGGSTNSDLTATASIIDDSAGNSTYTYTWEFVLPGDVTVEPSTISGGGTGDTSWNFAAPNVNQPDGLSDSGQALTVKVTVTGDDYDNSGSAEAQFGIALLADVNNSAGINVADRSIINAFWRTGSAGSFTLKDCDVNSDGSVNVADRSITNAVWRGQLGQSSVSSPCPFR